MPLILIYCDYIYKHNFLKITSKYSAITFNSENHYLELKEKFQVEDGIWPIF